MKRRAGPADTTPMGHAVASAVGAELEQTALSDVPRSAPSVSVLAHELRNTLMAIKWAADFMSDELLPDDPSRANLDLIQRAVEDGLARTEIALSPDRRNPVVPEQWGMRSADAPLDEPIAATGAGPNVDPNVPAGPPVPAGPTVLVVDDDAVLRRLIERMLDRLGYRPRLAATVAGGVAIAAAEPVDVVLTDIVLPDGTGPDVVAAIRAVSPGIQALYMTGHSASSARAVSPLGETDDVLEKPFTVESLDHAIRMAASRAQDAGETGGA